MGSSNLRVLYVVVDNDKFGYIHPNDWNREFNRVGILAAKGAYHTNAGYAARNGVTSTSRKDVRVATEEDFTEYRVSIPSDFNIATNQELDAYFTY